MRKLLQRSREQVTSEWYRDVELKLDNYWKNEGEQITMDSFNRDHVDIDVLTEFRRARNDIRQLVHDWATLEGMFGGDEVPTVSHPDVVEREARLKDEGHDLEKLHQLFGV